MGTGSFPRVKSGRAGTLTTHPLLVPRSWKSRAIPLLTLWTTTGPVTGTIYTFHFNVILKLIKSEDWRDMCHVCAKLRIFKFLWSESLKQGLHLRDECLVLNWMNLYHGFNWLSVVSCPHYRTWSNAVVSLLNGEITWAIDYYNSFSKSTILKQLLSQS